MEGMNALESVRDTFEIKHQTNETQITLTGQLSPRADGNVKPNIESNFTPSQPRLHNKLNRPNATEMPPDTKTSATDTPPTRGRGSPRQTEQSLVTFKRNNWLVIYRRGVREK